MNASSTVAALPPNAKEILSVRARMGSRQRGLRDYLYPIYLVLVLGGMACLFAWGTIAELIEHATPAAVARWGPPVLALVLIQSARFGIWQGPVTFSQPDCAHLLTAPVPQKDLVRPRLTTAMGVGAAIGALSAVIIYGAVAVNTGFSLLALCVCSLAVALFAVCAVCLSWHVERNQRLAEVTAAATPLAVVLTAGLVVAAIFDTHLLRELALWSGPWGWIFVPLSEGWIAATGALVLFLGCSLGLILSTSRRCTAPSERFITRARTRSSINASIMVFDARTAAVSRRSALSVRAPRHRPHLPTPKKARWAVAWRNCLSYRRLWKRTTVALLAVAAGGYLLFGFASSTVLASSVGGIIIYFGAAFLLEPMRIEVDGALRARVLFPQPYGQLLLQHCLAATVLVGAALLCGIVAAGTVGLTPWGVALGGALLTPALAAVTVLLAACSARRGGVVPLKVIVQSVASGEMGLVVLFFWYTGWLLTAVTATVGCASLLTLAGGTPIVLTGLLGAGLLGVMLALRRVIRKATPLYS